MADERPVIIMYPDEGSPDGRQYEVASVALATELHPDATIIKWADTGEPYEAPPATAR
jgi:hypothetical protein